MLSYKKHYPPCPPRQRRTSVARKNSGDYRMDCSPSAPSMRFSALFLAFRKLTSVCTYMLTQPHYPTRFSYCNRLYALICFHIRTIPIAFRRGGARSSRCTEPFHSHNNCKKTIIPRKPPTPLPCLPPLHRILLPSHLSFLFNILITANFNFAVYHIDGILSFPLSLDFPS